MYLLKKFWISELNDLCMHKLVQKFKSVNTWTLSLFFQKSSKKSNNGKAIDKKRNLCLLSQARVECGQLLTLSKLQKTLASNKRSSSLFFKCVIHLIRFDMKLQYLDLNMKSDCKLEVTSGAIRSEKKDHFETENSKFKI